MKYKIYFITKIRFKFIIFKTIPAFVVDVTTYAVHAHSNPFVLPDILVHSWPDAGPRQGGLLGWTCNRAQSEERCWKISILDSQQQYAICRLPLLPFPLSPF